MKGCGRATILHLHPFAVKLAKSYVKFLPAKVLPVKSAAVNLYLLNFRTWLIRSTRVSQHFSSIRREYSCAMTPERFQLISKIYHAALACTQTERGAFLDRHCAGDPELRHYVRELLAGGKSAEAELLSLAMKESVRRLNEDSPPPLVGQLLDHYEVLSLVGSGGMGEVYRARDVNLGRDVAIKLLPSGFSSGTERRRFEREARAASALNHPNILTIHEIEQTTEHRFLVSEFIDGQTLRARLGMDRIPLSEALEITIQVGSAL